jgi:hypothetical protein
MSDESSANPADEIIEVLRPVIATMHGALLMVATIAAALCGMPGAATMASMKIRS